MTSNLVLLGITKFLSIIYHIKYSCLIISDSNDIDAALGGGKPIYSYYKYTLEQHKFK